MSVEEREELDATFTMFLSKIAQAETLDEVFEVLNVLQDNAFLAKNSCKASVEYPDLGHEPAVSFMPDFLMKGLLAFLNFFVRVLMNSNGARRLCT